MRDLKLFFPLILFALFFVCVSNLFSQEAKQYRVACIAFYNVENLFDTINSPGVNDMEFTPEGRSRWNSSRYFDKLDKLSDVISQIGMELTPDGPAVLGLAEVENRSVLEDLVSQNPIAERNYEIVHFDSRERRGIDVALIYQPKYFQVTNTKTYPLIIEGNPDFASRDQLLVSGIFDGEPMHFIVAHWPSRSGGEKRSRPLRVAAANIARHMIDSILQIDPQARIFFMGDLNDDPLNVSIRKHLRTCGSAENLKPLELFNPYEPLHRKGVGTLAWRDAWNLFDQIILSQPLIGDNEQRYRFHSAHVFNKKFLQQPEGRFQGYPFRSYAGGAFLGGYSDHFPVYLFIIREN
jgi:hypothetical protein